MGISRALAILAVVFTPATSILYSQASMSKTNHGDFLLYVGTYSKGVYGYRFDTATGDAQPLGLMGEITNPSFIATDSKYKNLYAASELDGNVDGKVGAFAINRETGLLQLWNTRSSDGEAPCHVSVDATGKIVLVANYGTGGVAVFPIEHDGGLGEMKQLLTAKGSSVNHERQAGPHAHEAVISPDNRFAYVPDLGLDHIRIYKIDAAAGSLSPNDPPFAQMHPGNGPRHIALTSDGKFAYVINELNPVVTVFTRDPATGALTQIQEVSTLPEGFKGGEVGPAEIELDRAGKFLYASNRGPGTIAVFAVAPGSGTLKQVQVAATGNTWPRGFLIDPSGKWLIAGDHKANKFVVFRIDPDAGTITLTGKSFDVSSPVSFVFVPVLSPR